ncbi:hypothetical protein H0H92_003875 [Tricholoma furcatifolium]|nr:hypothetical protein H0H92_003875 [Tricholoma furcatifolium]
MSLDIPTTGASRKTAGDESSLARVRDTRFDNGSVGRKPDKYIFPSASGTSGSFGVPAEPDEKRVPLDVRSLDEYALERWEITSVGFQFLLHSPHDQLWALLLQYLDMAEQRQMDLVEVLSFLFMLSTMQLGREYSTEKLGISQNAMLEDLRDYGLIWQRKPSSKRFSPTRLSTTLTSSSPPLPATTGTGSGSGPQDGFIVLETNYRIYAYTGTEFGKPV